MLIASESEILLALSSPSVNIMTALRPLWDFRTYSPQDRRRRRRLYRRQSHAVLPLPALVRHLRATPATSAGTSPTAALPASTLPAHVLFQYVELVKRALELGPRGRQVLQQLDFPVEMDEKCVIAIFAQNFLEERPARLLFTAEHSLFASAGIDEEPER